MSMVDVCVDRIRSLLKNVTYRKTYLTYLLTSTRSYRPVHMAVIRWTVLWTLAVHWSELSIVGAAICTDHVCSYQFDVSLHKTMMYRDEYLHLNPVQLNGTQLQVKVVHEVRTVSPDDVILADGFSREVIVFNEQLPGPTIEVMEGAEVCQVIVES